MLHLVVGCGSTLRQAVGGGVQQGVLGQNGESPQDEGGKQVHVDIVAHAVQLPGKTRV